MKKIILLLFVLYSSVFSAPPFTVENVDNLRVIIKSDSESISKKQIKNIKLDIEKKLQLLNIGFSSIDPNILIIKIEIIEIKKIKIANIQFIIGEEIVTKRKNNIQTLAFTYYANDFFEIEENIDIKESVEAMMEQFTELYEEDME